MVVEPRAYRAITASAFGCGGTPSSSILDILSALSRAVGLDSAPAGAFPAYSCPTTMTDRAPENDDEGKARRSRVSGRSKYSISP